MHCTGYQWDTPSQKEAIEFAMTNSKKLGLKISFDIADPFCIERNVVDFKKIISEHVDVLFGNNEEVRILTGKEDPIEAGKEMRKMGAKIVIVKIGSKGSYLFYDDIVEKIDIYTPDKVLDSTGCGDIFAGGFLYAYTKNYEIKKCVKIASYLASQIISVPGVQLEAMDYTKINTFRAYGGAVNQRGSGASEAAKFGAVAVVVRSMASQVDDVPHTGSLRYQEGVKQIPAVAVSTKDADFLSTVLKKVETIVKSLNEGEHND